MKYNHCRYLQLLHYYKKSKFSYLKSQKYVNAETATFPQQLRITEEILSETVADFKFQT